MMSTTAPGTIRHPLKVAAQGLHASTKFCPKIPGLVLFSLGNERSALITIVMAD